jgi:hypothetical protein
LKVGIALIKVREVEDSDLIPLADFLPRGFPSTTKEFWLPLFELWWTLNPAYTDQFPRGWVLDRAGSIVGFIGNIPVNFMVGSEVRTAVASNSWYVDPSARGIFSFILFNAFLKQKNTSLFLFKGEENKHIINILSKYHFEKFILPESHKEYVYIIDKKKVKSIFFAFLINSRMPKLSNSFEYIRRLGFLFSAYVHQKPVNQESVPDKEYSCSVCTSCDESFYQLWKQSLNLCDVTISHDAKTLNWLYFSRARYSQRVVIQCHRSRDKKLAGYMVFDLIRKNPSEVGSMQLLDICVENNNPQVLASLSSFALDLGKQHNIALLVVWAPNPESEMYFKSVFTMRRTVQHYRYVRFSDSHEMKSERDKYHNICLPLLYPPQ